MPKIKNPATSKPATKTPAITKKTVDTPTRKVPLNQPTPPQFEETIAIRRPGARAGRNGTDRNGAVPISLPDGSVRMVAKGTRAGDLLREADIATPYPIVAARFCNKVTSLDRPLDKAGALAPVHLATRDGMLIYRRSLMFVLIKAVADLFPDLRVYINHSINDGYYGECYNREIAGEDAIPLNESDIAAIDRRMREIVAADMPIQRTDTPVEEARDIFREAGMMDKVKLLGYSEDPTVSIYRLENQINHFYGQLAPSTGMLGDFELRSLAPGFVLRFSERGHPGKMLPFHPKEKMFRVLREYEHWQKILSWRTVPDLNELIDNGIAREYVLIAEALHEKRIAELADRIHAENPRIILLSGPSASGKTTTINRLSIQMRVLGYRPVIINMDDFFVNREDTPKDESGEYDFENFHAVDVARLQETVRGLLREEEVILPKFNFQAGRSFPGRALRLEKGQILLMEGIHALNHELLPTIPDGLKFKIYASPLTHLNIDDHNRISASDVRLLRRLVRDFHYRGYKAVETLQRWPSVRRGEEVNIFPYEDNADYIFNSALPYELSILKPFAKEVLSHVNREDQEFSEAARLMKFLTYFRPMDPDHVPRHSLLREFIGGSCFDY